MCAACPTRGTEAEDHRQCPRSPRRRPIRTRAARAPTPFPAAAISFPSRAARRLCAHDGARCSIEPRHYRPRPAAARRAEPRTAPWSCGHAPPRPRRCRQQAPRRRASSSRPHRAHPLPHRAAEPPRRCRALVRPRPRHGQPRRPGLPLRRASPPSRPRLRARRGHHFVRELRRTLATTDLVVLAPEPSTTSATVSTASSRAAIELASSSRHAVDRAAEQQQRRSRPRH